MTMNLPWMIKVKLRIKRFHKISSTCEGKSCLEDSACDVLEDDVSQDGEQDNKDDISQISTLEDGGRMIHAREKRKLDSV
jgi:hypothetical protein